jgi:hypothetical protein
MLKSSGITRDEVLENHEEVLNLLEFQDNYLNQRMKSSAPKGKDEVEMPEATPLPDESSLTLGKFYFRFFFGLCTGIN